MDRDTVTVVEANWTESAPVLIEIRTKVFVEEQHVRQDEELDGLDESCVHYLASTSSGECIGTARLIPTGQIGRMAVLPTWRKQGIGEALLLACIKGAQQREIDRIFLHAQTHAIDFYSRYGFTVIGDEFDDAGIPHQEMVYSEQ